MIFTSKYNIGDALVSIHLASVDRPPVECSACLGTGECSIMGEKFCCPKCLGKGTTQARGRGWVILDGGVIGNIKIETPTSHNSGDEYRNDAVRDGAVFAYMFSSSGSGSVYNEANLWPRADAQAECDRRNAEDA